MGIILAFVIAFFVAFLIYLLTVRLVVFIDTNANQYYIRIGQLIKASVIPDVKEVIKLKVKVFVLTFYIDPFRMLNKKKSKNKPEKLLKKKKQNRSSFGFRKILRLIKSFKIKKFYLNIDTGDCIQNAKLYPVFEFLNFNVGGFKINFEGQNKLLLNVENRPIHIIKAFFNY